MFKISPHTHPESALSGSTIESMIDTAAAYGRTHFAYTDPSYMTSLLRGYDYAKKKKLKYIPGVEVLFKDASDNSRARYFKTTLYATTQVGFETLSKLSSKPNRPTIISYGQELTLWDWSDLEIASKSDVILCTSDLHDIVAKHLLLDTPVLAETAFKRLISLFSGRMYVAVVGVESTHSWISMVEADYDDGSKDVFMSTDRLQTNAARRVSPKELVENPNKHRKVITKIVNGIFSDVGKNVTKAAIKEGFLRLPTGDAQLKANKLMYALAKKHGVPVLYSDFAYYSTAEDKAVQDVRLSQDDIREHAKRHMQTSEEAISYLKNIFKMGDAEVEQVLSQNNEFASRFDKFELKFDFRVPEVDGGNALGKCLQIIKENRRLPNNPVYHDRLKYEISVLAKNGKVDLTPYFLPIRDVLNYYKEHGKLTGPARGSAAGSLFMYLMGITQVDPIKYDLSFERFLSLDRVLTGSFPDVDVDLVDRELLVGKDAQSGYLYGRWGNKAAQISTRILLRLKSAIKDVNRYINEGRVDPLIEKLSKSLPPPPQGVSDKDFVFGFEDDDGNHHNGLIEINSDLQEYAQSRPKEWDIVQRCLGISRQHSKHASAFVISDVPVNEIVPTFMGNITQYEAKAVEKAKLIKYDFLVVNQLKDIELAIKLINKKNDQADYTAGYFSLEKDGLATEQFIWSLPEDPEVFKSVWGGSTETLFQINTSSMIPFVKEIMPQSVEDLACILALVRPGPLDFIDEKTGRNMAEEYIQRRLGHSEPDIPELAALVPETYGILVYQEQVNKIARAIGGLEAADAENLRRVMSKKNKTEVLKYKTVFMEGAKTKLKPDVAEKIWAQMETFSRYGFNKSHAVSYAMITYACMFLKHYYPLEWWAAVLSNADEGEISNDLFKHVRDKVSPPDINISTDQMTIDYSSRTIRAKLTILRGLGDTVAKPIVENRPYADIKDFVKKRVAGTSLTRKLIHAGVMDSLFPTNATLLDKMQAFEDATKQVDYDEKVAAGKKPRPAKKGEVPEEYVGIHPLEDFQRKKDILPTLPMRLSPLFVKYGGLLNEGSANSPMYFLAGWKSDIVRFFDGDQLQRIESQTDLEIEFCCVAYITKAEEFSYAKGSRKALKMNIDVDGYMSERVIWPNYDTGILEYPNDLGKGAIVLLHMYRKPEKTDTRIISTRVIKSLTK